MDIPFTTYHNILHGSLRPWLNENKPDEKFASMIDEIPDIQPDFPEHFDITFHRPFNHKTKYYQKLIINEAIKYCNQVYDLINEDDRIKYRKYWRNKLLDKKLCTLLQDTGKIIKESKYDLLYIDPRKTTYDIDQDHKTHTYIIQFLKFALMKTYLEIQELYKCIQTNDLLIEDDLYIQMLFEPVPDKSFLKRKYDTIEISDAEVNEDPELKKLTFGYKHKSPEKLNNVCQLLTLKIDFINEDICSQEDFIEIMTSKDLSKITRQIHIGCETTQFRYIIDKMKTDFRNLTLSNIEKSELFYSKRGNLIKASNLSRNKQESPKEKEEIDNIFKELQ